MAGRLYYRLVYAFPDFFEVMVTGARLDHDMQTQALAWDDLCFE